MALFSRRGERNKPYQVSRAKISSYLQRIELFELDDNNSVKRILVEESILRNYNPNQGVRMVDFLATDDLCLVFDDEVLVLKVKKDQISQHHRIVLSSIYKESVFLGAYKNAYLFSKPFVKIKDFSTKEGSVEYIPKDELIGLIEGNLSQVEQLETTNRFEQRSLILVSEESRFGGGCRESGRGVGELCD